MVKVPECVYIYIYSFIYLFLEVCLTVNLYHRSGISDSGIGMICNVFSETLTRLLLALCPNVSSSNHILFTQLLHKPSFGLVSAY